MSGFLVAPAARIELEEILGGKVIGNQPGW
jgi:hypothetical protein